MIQIKKEFKLYI